MTTSATLATTQDIRVSTLGNNDDFSMISRCWRARRGT
jgi:hypothetical protein